MLIGEKIRQSLAQGPAVEAMKFGDRWLSWGDLAGMAAEIDRILTAAGLGPGARIGIAGRNRPSHFTAMFGLLAAGRAVILLNPFIAPARLAEQVAALRLPALIADAEDWAAGALDGVMAQLSGLGIVLEEGAAQPVTARAGAETWTHGPATDAFAPGLAMEMFTSGTTGEPKRIAYSVEALTQCIEGNALWAERMGEAPASNAMEAALIMYAPFVHISGLCTSLQMASEGRRLICLEKFTPEGWLAAAREARLWMGPLPPAMLRMFMELNVPPEDLSFLRSVRSGGAALDAETRDGFVARYGAPVLPVYGATEYGGPIAGWWLEDYRSLWAKKNTSTGRIDRKIADARVVDATTGEELPQGAQGVLEVKAYRMGPDWMRTTDIASIDADDFLYIHGRTDDAINRGGFKVVPTVVEAELRRHPLVGDAVVLGLDDARLGQVPVAVVEPGAGQPLPTEAEVIEHARDRLVRYQVPARIIVLPQIPRTTIGKPNRVAIRALFAPVSAG
ncbi:hypothetical protein GCM10011341_36920 [Frigidibacter albus]|nr:hypothetical protein GCM10011341_36920 [Frigidibacter albus]